MDDPAQPDASDGPNSPPPGWYGNRYWTGSEWAPPAPGWYPSPEGRGEAYWNGEDWTADWRKGPTHERSSVATPLWILVAILALPLIVLAIAFFAGVIDGLF